MSKSYDIWFCDCGRIHTMPSSYLDLIEGDIRKRSVVRVCNHCGVARQIWLDDYEGGYCICGNDVIDRELTTEDGKEYKMIFSKGIMVPMKSGGFADWKCTHTFVDMEAFKPTNLSVDMACKQNHPCVSVDTERLIHSVKDKDILKAISGYVVDIKWTGTKFERSWNK